MSRSRNWGLITSHLFSVRGFFRERVASSATVMCQFCIAEIAKLLRELSDSAPPIIITFFLTRKAFIELAELFQTNLDIPNG